MSNPWKINKAPVQVHDLTEIMSEEVARGLQNKEEMKFAEMISNSEILNMVNDDVAPELVEQLRTDKAAEYCDSDSVIAKVLQCQFDREFDEQMRKEEKKLNGTSKVSISYDKYRNIPEHLIYDSDDDEEVYFPDKRNWDRFESNEKEFANIPKCGYKVKDGEVITKHDSVISGRRNACKVMAFPPEFHTGDGAGFDMKLPNAVFNSLKAHSRSEQARRHKMLDRKESQATAVMGVDERTKLLLFKLINNGLLESVNGVVSTGKESIVLHADCDTSYPDAVLPKECAIKVFKTTLNEFKTRDKYIEADYRFKDRFSKQNPRKIVHMWAEKEMHNMMRIHKIGLNCPDIICLKKHMLVMSFIGSDNRAAPKLKDVILKSDEWKNVYEEVEGIMHKLFNVGHLIHADLSEYNILYHEGKCWLIDVSQSVEPDHPHGLEFLLRDCKNITSFFTRKNVDNVKSSEELFKYITGIEEIDVNLLEGVRSKGAADSLVDRFEVELDDARNVSYPFEYVWQKTYKNKQDDGRSRHKSKNNQSECYDTDDNFDEKQDNFQKDKTTQDDNKSELENKNRDDD